MLRIIHTAIIHIMETFPSALGWGGGSAGVLPGAGAGVVGVGVGEDVAGAATLTAAHGTAMAPMATAMVTTAMGIMAMVTMAMGIMAMAMVTMAMAAVITVMGIRMDWLAGILPGHPIPADTQVGMPAPAEDLRVVSLAGPDSQADTVGLWPQQDIRADQPPLGGVNLELRQQDTPPREQHLEQAVRAQREQLHLGHAKRPGLSQQGPHPRGLQQGLGSR
jgi:hypothetical protein